MSSRAIKFQSIKAVLHNLRHARRIAAQRKALRILSTQESRKIVIGSSGTAPEGWISTDREVIDLLREDTWSRYFNRDSLDAILAEHVWEHLSTGDAVGSARTCFRFLKPGGYLRAAVPDGLHPDPVYIDQVKPGGSGPGADDHKVLYNFSSFCDLFALVGFEVRLHEYYDRNGHFQFNDWSPADGLIRRSMRFDERNSPQSLAYTSIIVDAVKPLTALGLDCRASTRS